MMKILGRCYIWSWQGETELLKFWVFEKMKTSLSHAKK